MRTPDGLFSKNGLQPAIDLLHGNVSERTGNKIVYEGYIEDAELEDGLYVKVWNCVFADALSFKLESCPDHEAELFTLAYTITPESISFHRASAAKTPPQEHRYNTMFSNNKLPLYITVSNNQNIQVVYITMTLKWLDKHFKYSSPVIQALFSNLQQSSNPTLLFDKCSVNEFIYLMDIFNQTQQHKRIDLFVHSRVLLLITAFCEHFGKGKNVSYHMERFIQIQQVEAIISDSLTTSLPSVKEIAARLAVSESVLQRYFKIIYGMSIYEYYLDKKMSLAQRMLIEKNLRVNEVAVQLNYETTSSFINAFKKHFGYLPGSIRKG